MPANVPDARLRGRQRAEKRRGHAKGGNHTWRSWMAKPTRAEKTAQAPGESWWVGLSRDAFTEVLKQRVPSYSQPMAHWRTTAPRAGWK